VHHWTDRLFSFTTTRDPALRFSNGHFTMIGLKVNDKPLLRAYSIVSANYEEHLEFLSHQGARRPADLAPAAHPGGRHIIVGKKPTGTLLIDYLLPAKRLYLMSTGTGLAPFLSVIRDPRPTSVRAGDPGARRARGGRAGLPRLPHQGAAQHEFLGEMISRQLKYYPTVTREPFRTRAASPI
jgi:ferredoxin--NADP+ reductase